MLLETIDISVKDPREPQQQVVFLTNLILCLKKGGLQAAVEDAWLTNCVKCFFLPLVDIIKPCAILVLGQKTTEAILRAYRIPFSRPKRFSDMLGPFPLLCRAGGFSSRSIIVATEV